MIKIISTFSPIKAVISAPSSKGHTLRAFFIASLAEGESVLKDPLLAEDQKYAIEALKKFGIRFKSEKNKIIVKGSGGNLKLPSGKIFIGNSGVTARFLASFAALTPAGKIIIDGAERMREGRPIQDLIDALNKLGVKIKSVNRKGCLPIEIQGNSFKGGGTKLKGEISSQYFSSILISAPYSKKDVIIEALGEISSKPYIDITSQMMADFGVKIKNQKYKKFYIKSGQKYKSRSYQIEGDYTNASYFFSAVAICGGKIIVKNLRLNSTQGDKIFLDCLEKMGCKVIKKPQEITVINNGKNLKSIKKIDMNSYPDLVPSLAIVSIFAKGITEIYNIAHLRFKECDRIKALVKELKKIGARVKEKKDGLVIYGNPENLHGAAIECYNDHRIAMSFSIVGLKVPDIFIKDEKCVEKSFINFYETFKKIGGNYEKR